MNEPRLAVVIPAGPGDDVADTVASVLHYTSSPRLVVVVDDTRTGACDQLRALSPDVQVLRAPAHAPGVSGGLFVKLSAGYRFALATFSFDVLLRLDADALVIGSGLAQAAAARFAADPAVGLLGSYAVRSDGQARDWQDAGRLLRHECTWRGLDRPAMRRVLAMLRGRARANGYVDGEHALGGAYVHSAAAVQAIADHGWLDLPVLRRSRLGEDHLFALITVAAGYRVADFGGPDDPLALAWKGLPSAPEELLARGKLVTHSVRYWGDRAEPDIRATFARARALADGAARG